VVRRALSHALALRVALVVLVAALVAAVFLAHASTTRRPAPPLPTAVRQGPAVTLADLRGHAAAIVFWAAWCDNCHTEAPSVARFARSAGGRGHVIGVDSSDSGNWRGFLHTYRWTFPVLADTDGITSSAYGLSGLPATVIIDARGRIASIRYGVQTVAGLRSELAAAG
jgi:cytochrome c biogenesis protein CcmG, thiol:disulfide interchange protein DsbE